MDKLKIGRRLKSVRGDKYTQTELAEMLGVGKSIISMYETGNRIPSDDIKVKYSQIFGVSIQALFFD